MNALKRMLNGKPLHEKIEVMSNLAICVLFYERVDQTIKCIKSFVPSGIKIFILNNGSAKSSREVLGKYCQKYPNITIFDSDTNLGVAIGRNYLLEHTTEEWLLFIDNDISVKKRDWLKRFKRHVSLRPDIEVFIPKLFLSHDNINIEYFRWEIKEKKGGFKKICWLEIINDITNNFPGGASFVNRKLFNRLGLYDEKIFIGFEDYELCLRAISMGKPVKARLIHDIELVHDRQHIRKNEDRNAVLRRYDSRTIEASANRIFEKHKIVLDCDWRIWIKDQVELLLGKRDQKTMESLLIGRKFNLANIKKKMRSIYNIFFKKICISFSQS